MTPKLYTVFVVDGTFVDAGDIETNYLRFDNLDAEVAKTLVDLSVEQGFDAVIREADQEKGCQKE